MQERPRRLAEVLLPESGLIRPCAPSAEYLDTTVKKDRGVDLDYSVDSIKVVEEELARVSKEVDNANPQQD